MSKVSQNQLALILGLSIPFVFLILISICIRIYRNYFNNDSGNYSRLNKSENVNEDEQNIILNFDKSDIMDNEDLSFEMTSFDTDFDDGDDALDELDYSRLSELERFRHNLISGSDPNDDMDVVNVEYESYESFVNPLQDQNNDLEKGRRVKSNPNNDIINDISDSNGEADTGIILNENDDYVNESSVEYDGTNTTINTKTTEEEEQA